MNNARSYGLLVAKAAELEPLGFLQAYRNDLREHDRKELEAAPDGDHFLWFIRETGTWIVLRSNYAAEPPNKLLWPRVLMRNAMDQKSSAYQYHRAFHFAGGSALVELATLGDVRAVAEGWRAALEPNYVASAW